jgi:hypothetical protein
MSFKKQHNDDTKTKISASMKDAWRRVQSSNGAPAPSDDGQGPPVIDETAVIGWLNTLDDSRYYAFVKSLVSRYREIHARQSSQ